MRFTPHGFSSRHTSARIFVTIALFIACTAFDSGCSLHNPIHPAVPSSLSCIATPPRVYPGDIITLTATPANIPGSKPLSFSWTAPNLRFASPNTDTTSVNTTALPPGDYTATAHLTRSRDRVQLAACQADFTVVSFEPPTATCSASAISLGQGHSATVVTHGISPQNRPLTYSYSVSAGSVNGPGPTAVFNSTGAPLGNVTITCNIVDDKGNSASAGATIHIIEAEDARTPPPNPTASHAFVTPLARRSQRHSRRRRPHSCILASCQARPRPTMNN